MTCLQIIFVCYSERGTLSEIEIFGTVDTYEFLHYLLRTNIFHCF